MALAWKSSKQAGLRVVVNSGADGAAGSDPTYVGAGLPKRLPLEMMEIAGAEKESSWV